MAQLRKKFGLGFGLQAAGKALSGKNAKKLKILMKSAQDLSQEIAEILKEADASDLDEDGVPVVNVFDTPSSAADGRAVEEGTQAAIANQISAESQFATYLKRATWYERLDTTLRLFSYYFEDACYDASIDEPQTGDNSIEAMISDLVQVLNELSQSYGAISAANKETVQAAAMTDFVQLEASSGIEFVAAGENTYPVAGVLFRVDEPSEGVPSVGPGLPLYISSAVAKAAVSQVLGLPLDAHDSLAAHANEEIVGVMLGASVREGDFCIRGQLYPFNQPEKVAAIKANQGKLGMSMNALAPGHVENIGGRQVHVVDKLTLLGANILYAQAATYKQTKLVASTATAANDTEAAVATVGTVATPAAEAAVPLAQRLSPEPIGTVEQANPNVGNSDRAEIAEDSVPVAIAASAAVSTEPDQSVAPTNAASRSVIAEAGVAPDNSIADSTADLTPPNKPQGDDEVSNEALDKLTSQLTALGDTVSQMMSNFQQFQQSVTDNLGGVTTQVTNLVAERDAAKAQEAATAAAAQTEAQRKANLDEMQSMMRTAAQQAVAQVFNPSGQPARVSTPPTVQAAGAGSIEQPLDPESPQVQLIRAEAQLDTLSGRFDPSSMQQRLTLRDKIHNLKSQLGQI